MARLVVSDAQSAGHRRFVANTVLIVGALLCAGVVSFYAVGHRSSIHTTALTLSAEQEQQQQQQQQPQQQQQQQQPQQEQQQQEQPQQPQQEQQEQPQQPQQEQPQQEQQQQQEQQEQPQQEQPQQEQPQQEQPQEQQQEPQQEQQQEQQQQEQQEQPQQEQPQEEQPQEQQQQEQQQAVAEVAQAAQAGGDVAYMPVSIPSGVRLIRDTMLSELWSGDEPLAYARAGYVDGGYPHTYIKPELIATVLHHTRPAFWLEMGSFIGGSAIRTAKGIKEAGLDTSVICVDPFTGDVNMWAWEKGGKAKHEWLFLRLEQGRPTVYDRFRANVVEAKMEDVILPIVASSLVGMKLIERLISEERLSVRPQVIYLDSAHEKDETLLELRHAWNLMSPGGVLFGDDWGWGAVQEDVKEFAASLGPAVNTDMASKVHAALPGSEMQGNVLLYEWQWVLFKP